VQSEDVASCVKALEKELFTPNLPTFANIESFGSPETQTPENDNEADCSIQVSCDPFSTDFTIEPEVHISITDTSVENFILPVDSDYSSEKLEKMLSQSFQISNELVHNKKVIVLANNQTTNCYECKTDINTEHYSKKSVCTKCNYMTHCKKAYAQHMIDAHSTSRTRKCWTSSVLRSFPSLDSYNIVCQKCHFVTKDGNQMGIHFNLSSNFFSLIIS